MLSQSQYGTIGWPLLVKRVSGFIVWYEFNPKCKFILLKTSFRYTKGHLLRLFKRLLSSAGSWTSNLYKEKKSYLEVGPGKLRNFQKLTWRRIYLRAASNTSVTQILSDNSTTRIAYKFNFMIISHWPQSPQPKISEKLTFRIVRLDVF